VHKGVIAMQTSDRNGALIGAIQIFNGDELMLISDMGTLVRTKGDEVSVLGRNTQGVRLIKLRDEEMLNSVSRIEEQEETQTTEADAAEAGDEAADAD
jgi:DNA gyrase subunit A